MFNVTVIVGHPGDNAARSLKFHSQDEAVKWVVERLDKIRYESLKRPVSFYLDKQASDGDWDEVFCWHRY